MDEGPSMVVAYLAAALSGALVSLPIGILIGAWLF
jgi:hypothetical protein